LCEAEESRTNAAALWGRTRCYSACLLQCTAVIYLQA
jgi:hypothetical protein